MFGARFVRQLEDLNQSKPHQETSKKNAHVEYGFIMVNTLNCVVLAQPSPDSTVLVATMMHRSKHVLSVVKVGDEKE